MHYKLSVFLKTVALTSGKYRQPGNDGGISTVSEAGLACGRLNRTKMPNAKVGIYWCVGKTVIGEAVLLATAEPYGDALQYGGHYDFWRGLKAQTDAERGFKSHAYDYYPRGRVVYFNSRQQFRLYVDGCISSELRAAVVAFFNLDAVGCEVERDAHYQCAGCNRGFLE